MRREMGEKTTDREGKDGERNSNKKEKRKLETERKKKMKRGNEKKREKKVKRKTKWKRITRINFTKREKQKLLSTKSVYKIIRMREGDDNEKIKRQNVKQVKRLGKK